MFCSFGGLYTLCLDLQAKDTSHVGGYVLWIVVGAVPLARFARGEARRYHARTIARRLESYSGPEVPLRWLYNSVGMDAKDLAWYFENGYFANLSLDLDQRWSANGPCPATTQNGAEPSQLKQKGAFSWDFLIR